MVLNHAMLKLKMLLMLLSIVNPSFFICTTDQCAISVFINTYLQIKEIQSWVRNDSWQVRCYYYCALLLLLPSPEAQKECVKFIKYIQGRAGWQTVKRDNFRRQISTGMETLQDSHLPVLSLSVNTPVTGTLTLYSLVFPLSLLTSHDN